MEMGATTMAEVLVHCQGRRNSVVELVTRMLFSLGQTVPGGIVHTKQLIAGHPMYLSSAKVVRGAAIPHLLSSWLG